MAILKSTTINGNLEVSGDIYQQTNKVVPVILTSSYTTTNFANIATAAPNGTPIDNIYIATSNTGTSGNTQRILYIWTETNG